jgi:hypothetical protein
MTVGDWAKYVGLHLLHRSNGYLLAAAVFLIVTAAVWLKPEAVTDESLETRVLSVLDRLLMKTRFAQFPALPSYWLSAGVLNWSEGALTASVFFLLLLLSHALFFGFLVFNGMGRFFYDAASAVQSDVTKTSAKYANTARSAAINSPS